MTEPPRPFLLHPFDPSQVTNLRVPHRCPCAFPRAQRPQHPVLVVHEWQSMRIWMRCTRDILCSQPEHLISRQIRARTVRDEPAWAGDRRHSVFWLMSLTTPLSLCYSDSVRSGRSSRASVRRRSGQRARVGRCLSTHLRPLGARGLRRPQGRPLGGSRRPVVLCPRSPVARTVPTPRITEYS